MTGRHKALRTPIWIGNLCDGQTEVIRTPQLPHGESRLRQIRNVGSASTVVTCNQKQLPLTRSWTALGYHAVGPVLRASTSAGGALLHYVVLADRDYGTCL
jgi:hypothetical protein